MISTFFSKLSRVPSRRRKSEHKLKLNWIIDGKLAVGPFPKSDARQELLKKEGIRSILTLCSAEEGVLSTELHSEVAWTRIPLRDSHYEQNMDVENFARAVEQAKAYIQSSAPLYIHCVAGMERSPSVCVGYLCKYERMELWEALQLVKQANKKTNILDSQIRIIQTLVSQVL